MYRYTNFGRLPIPGLPVGDSIPRDVMRNALELYARDYPQTTVDEILNSLLEQNIYEYIDPKKPEGRLTIG